MKRGLILAVLIVVPPVCAQSHGRCSDANGYRLVNGERVEDGGAVGRPLRGWVGYTNTGHAVPAVTIQCFTGDGKTLLASTVTDDSGNFSLPRLKRGTYYLKAGKAGVCADAIIVSLVDSKSDAIACFVAEAGTEP